jgi:hypothetical protein
VRIPLGHGLALCALIEKCILLFALVIAPARPVSRGSEMNEAIRALQSAVSGVFRIGGEIWTWVIAQVGRLAQVNWLTLPLWKQVAVLLVAAGAGYCFYQVYKPIWNSFKQLLGAFGSFVSTLITTLPWIILGGLVIAVGLTFIRL